MWLSAKYRDSSHSTSLRAGCCDQNDKSAPVVPPNGNHLCRPGFLLTGYNLDTAGLACDLLRNQVECDETASCVAGAGDSVRLLLCNDARGADVARRVVVASRHRAR